MPALPPSPDVAARRGIPQTTTGGLRPGVRPPAGPLAPPVPEGGTAPIGAPMATPEPMRGLAANARIQIQQAVKLLIDALPALGPLSEDGKAVTSAMSTLQRAFGKTEHKTNEFMPSELLGILSAMRGAGAGARPGMNAPPGGPGGGPPGAGPGGPPGAGGVPPPPPGLIPPPPGAGAAAAMGG
jgi:hypothetical protein